MREALRVGVAGAQGRMGQTVVAVAAETPGVVVNLAFDRDDTPDLSAADVVIDFSRHDASAALAKICAVRGGPALVIGATGQTPEELDAITEAAQKIAIVKAGNFSLGVNLLMGLVRRAAAALPAEMFDIEVVEAHHNRKIDSPSGTALMLGEAAAEGRGAPLERLRAPVRDGVQAPRRIGDIGFSSVRGGGVIGEHSVILASGDEILSLSHSARDRSLFARGALHAALWVRDQGPGLYDMQNVLDLK